MTIGTMPRAWVSSALMGGRLRVACLYFMPKADGAWRAFDKPPAPSQVRGLQAAFSPCLRPASHQLVERDRLLRDLGFGKHELRDIVLDHDGLDFGQAAVVAVVPAHDFGRF